MQLWFEYDLRTDDDPGMVAVADAAAEHVPFFCFDPKQYVQVLPPPPPPPPVLFGLFPADALFSAIRCLIGMLRLSKQARCQNSAAAGSKAVI